MFAYCSTSTSLQFRGNIVAFQIYSTSLVAGFQIILKGTICNIVELLEAHEQFLKYCLYEFGSVGIEISTQSVSIGDPLEQD